jgi:Tol biopolymer transport system component/Leucine-rich repeat (LRR) protein
MRSQTVLLTLARLLLVLAIARISAVQADSVHSPHVQEQLKAHSLVWESRESRKSECQALVTIYESFNGPDWTDSRGWLESNQPCSWEGVTCRDGHVTEFGFLHVVISGTLPAAISDLPYLDYLYLENNGLSGELPEELGQLTQLTYLNLTGNKFSGPLPESLGNLQNLIELYLSKNSFSGSLPDSLWSLSELKRLYIGDNNFSGQIPAEIAKLSQLEKLYIGENQFSGPLPPEIGQFGNLYFLQISGNPFTGELPESIGYLPNIESLTISHTSLSGEVPDTIKHLDTLRFLYLNDNHFSGTFPYDIVNLKYLKALGLWGNEFEDINPLVSSLPNLELLNLSNNKLSGPVPAGIWKMQRMYILDLSNNQLDWSLPLNVDMPELDTLYLGNNRFSGEFPEQLLALPKLRHLYLENNELSGILPNILWTNSQLVDLDISGNAFTDQLPATFSMPSLFLLNLSRNQFHGELPDSIGSMKWVRTLILSENEFSGAIPTTLGSLVDLRTLDIRSNHFYGEIPSSITKLVNLNKPVWNAEPNGYTDLGHNHLTATDAVLRAFLANKDPDWESTQTYGYLPPKIVSIQPSMLMAGAGDTTLKVHGSDFMNGSVVYWNGEALPTNFQSNILLTASVSASRLSNPGSIEITVKNPEPTVGPSNSRTFYITPLSNSQTTRISLTSIGEEGNGPSSNPSISGDGRYIAFDSNASNLLPGNPNGHFHVYIYDRQAEQLQRVSALGRHSRWPSVSGDGRYVLFTSWNLPDTGDLSIQLYVHDRDTETTELVSRSSEGVAGNGSYNSNSISADGRFIAFSSDSDNLVPDDNNYSEDVFVHDRETGVTERVSVSSTGEEADYGDSSSASISADGRYVIFHSSASNLVEDDSNNRYDIFVHDRETKTVERISFRFEGNEEDADLYFPQLTPDARYVVFTNGGYVMVHDRQEKSTEIITPSPYASTQEGTISDDGRIVVYRSSYNPQDPNTPLPHTNFYIHDRSTGKYRLLSLTHDGNPLDKELDLVFISGDGSFIVTATAASNLVPEDSNKYSDVFIHYPCLDGICFPADNHPIPIITGLNPSNILAGSGDMSLEVQGEDFFEGATILWNGEAVPTTFVSSQKLHAVIPAAKLVESGTVEVSVKNPDPSAGPSDSLLFYISSIQPATGSTALTRRPEFHWPAVDGATSYQVQLSTSSSFGTLLMTRTSSTNTVLPNADLPLNRTIYWRMRARVNGAYQAWSPRYSFRSANPPSNPSLVSPANNALTTSSVPKLTWSQSSLPSGTAFEHYQLQIADDAAFTDESMVLDHTVTSRTAPNYTLPSGLLQPNTRYFWRVRAANTLGHFSNWSASRSIRAAMLPVESLYTPEGLTPRPQFTWSEVQGASDYTIQISIYSKFGETLINARITGASYTPTKDLPKNKTIYWRVRANGPNGPSLWANSSFKSANPPSTPVLSSPASNALVKTYTPKLSWRASSLPAGTTFKHYKLQVSKFKEFPDESDKTIEKLIDIRTAPFYHFVDTEKLDHNTIYYWRVQAWNTNDHYSTWSTVRSFRSAMLPPVLDQPG